MLGFPGRGPLQGRGTSQDRGESQAAGGGKTPSRDSSPFLGHGRHKRGGRVDRGAASSQRDEEGTVGRRRAAARRSGTSGVITTRGKKPPADIIVAAEHKMTTVNRCSIPVDQVITFAEFIETVFLPSAKEIKKPSTARGYESLWRLYLKPLVTSEK